MANPPSFKLKTQMDDTNLELVLQLQKLLEVALSTYTLLSHFLSMKVLNRNAIQSMIPKFWNFGGLVVTSYLRPNTYSISTYSLECYTKILAESPWHFMRKLFNVKEQDSGCSKEEVDMSIITFWVQVHNLPLDYMNITNAPIIGHQLGIVLKIKEPVYQGVLL